MKSSLLVQSGRNVAMLGVKLGKWHKVGKQPTQTREQAMICIHIQQINQFPLQTVFNNKGKSSLLSTLLTVHGRGK